MIIVRVCVVFVCVRVCVCVCGGATAGRYSVQTLRHDPWLQHELQQAAVQDEELMATKQAVRGVKRRQRRQQAVAARRKQQQQQQQHEHALGSVSALF